MQQTIDTARVATGFELESLSWRERHQSTIRIWRLYARTLSRNTSAMLGVGLVLVFFLAAVLGPWFVPYPEDITGAVNLDIKLQPPSVEHWFGTDEVGRDVFSRVVIGTQLTLKIALIIVGVATLIGVPLGLIAGYVGGVVQEVIMRVTDVFLGVPGLILAIAIVGALGAQVSIETP